jgi:spermidine/putrescine transport system ATP-binding protein
MADTHMVEADQTPHTGQGDGARVTPAVSVLDVVRRFGAVTAVAGVSLDSPQGAFAAILGPSGCGKTTLLRMIAGLERQDSGSIAINGVDVSRMASHRRPVNLVFQRYALFPHKTVADNISFALDLKRTRRAEVRGRVEDMLALVQLPGYGGRSIDQLSGGQAQRVALARALITEPAVLLLDEPLTALDLKLRQAMQVELREIQRRVGATFVYVTHDQSEAMVMSDVVILMNQGHVVQQGAPQEVYERPSALFSATFLGEANLFRATLENSRSVARAGDITFPIATPPPAGVDSGWVCVRPEDVGIAPAREPGPPATAIGRVTAATFIGPTVRYTVQSGQNTIQVEAPARRGEAPLLPEDEVALTWSAAAAVFIEAGDGDLPVARPRSTDDAGVTGVSAQ